MLRFSFCFNSADGKHAPDGKVVKTKVALWQWELKLQPPRQECKAWGYHSPYYFSNMILEGEIKDAKINSFSSDFQTLV